MLVLSRRPGEEIIINGNIKVTVVSLKGDRVRIGITAPDNVSVDRSEVHAKRMQFFEVPAAVLTSADSSVALGDQPIACGSSDTMVH